MLNLQTYVYLGMSKEGWKFLTPETIQGFMDEPKWLDDEEDQAFIDCFYKYFGDWCALYNSGTSGNR